MKIPDAFNRLLNVPRLTGWRIGLALAIAVIADGLQFLLGGIGWVGVNQVIDVVTAGLVNLVVGFHWLLLPTFVIEFIPVLDDLPTWTACVIAVVAIRKREQKATASGP